MVREGVRRRLAELDDHIVNLLAEDPTNERAVLEKLQEVMRGKAKGSVYQHLLYVLAHLKFGRGPAKQHFESILKHQQGMSRRLGRNVGFRVALLDYFLNLNKRIQNPKVIELSLYLKSVRAALTDPMTGLFNFRYLKMALDREMKSSKRHRLIFSVVFVDVDRFKAFNDTYGHLAGDRALRDLAVVFRRAARTEDTVCRYGGEEFLIVTAFTGKREAKVLAERLRSGVERLSFHGKKGRVTISVGIAEYPADGDTAKGLLKAADEALYAAKRNGKNRVELYRK